MTRRLITLMVVVFGLTLIVGVAAAPAETVAGSTLAKAAGTAPQMTPASSQPMMLARRRVCVRWRYRKRCVRWRHYRRRCIHWRRRCVARRHGHCLRWRRYCVRWRHGRRHCVRWRRYRYCVHWIWR